MLLLEMLLFMAGIIPLSFASKFQKQLKKTGRTKIFCSWKEFKYASLFSDITCSW